MRAVHQGLRCPGYASAAALCADPNVDAVYIATPHQFHAEHCLLAASHGKHIVVEKPLALTLEDCNAIIQAVERYGVKLIVGHTASYNQRPHALALSQVFSYCSRRV